jgi:hypothetical protein
MLNRKLLLVVSLCFVSSPLFAIDFERDVAPLIAKRCLECHNARQKTGSLDLTTQAGFSKGGESGPVFDASKPSESSLLERLRSGDMPPKQQGKSQKLPKSEIQIFEEWLNSGAKWPKDRVLDLYEATNDIRGGRDWWSFQPIVQPRVPVIENGRQTTKPIDAFVLSKLKEFKMTPAPKASKRVLIRRLYFDLLGLPPSFEQIKAFEADNDPKAFEKLVDRLLAAPQFGERWARYWLDLVRFAETCGYERDQEKPGIWMFRDWVVRAFNEDMPYNEFIIQQLAGDEIPNRTKQSTLATGFLMAGTWNDEPNDFNEYQYERLEDMIHVTSSAFLGLTVKCARCHNHKFDPIPQLDYYRLANAFWVGPIGRGRKALGGATKEELGYEVFGWTDLSSKPRQLRLLKNGDPKQPAEVVLPGHLSVVPKLMRPIKAAPEKSKTTTLRLQLANWIVDRKNPLTPRVIVNRLWQHHFGQAIVHSPNNFGFRGAPPTHPQLLEWLAAQLLQGDWKLKRIHKMIVMSETWQQSSLHPEQAKYERVDSENHRIWRANRRRLDAEALRDSMLTVSGEIDLRIGGPSFRPTISPEALEGLSRKQSAWKASPEKEQRRRSLYIFSKRGLLLPMMTTFDFADTTLPCGQRDVTIVPTQALAMLNNHFAHQQSAALSKRVLKKTSDIEQQAKLSWRFALSRNPNESELAASVAHLQRQAKHFSTGAEASDKNPAEIKTTDDVPVSKGLVLSLRADKGIEKDAQGRIVKWSNRVGESHIASQPAPEHRPTIISSPEFGQQSVYFDGQRRYMHIAGSVLKQQPCTMIAVVSDDSQHKRHRSIVSNWNGSQGNSTTSLFLGLTADANVRFSDNYNPAGVVLSQKKPFALLAINSSSGVDVFQNNLRIADRDNSLASRKLETPWVIGQQGNINGEYWHGHIAEILVYDRAISQSERLRIWSYLKQRYHLPTLAGSAAIATTTPGEKALASLCHVLLNSNEFIFVD